MSAVALASTPSSVVISNVIYVIGAFVFAALVASVIVLRHRRPKSIEANMNTFNRGLAALAPETTGRRRSGPPTAIPVQTEARLRVDSYIPKAGGTTPPEPSSGAETG